MSWLKDILVKWLVEPYIKKIPKPVKKAIGVLIVVSIAFATTNLELSPEVKEGLNRASEAVIELVPEVEEELDTPLQE